MNNAKLINLHEYFNHIYRIILDAYYSIVSTPGFFPRNLRLLNFFHGQVFNTNF